MMMGKTIKGIQQALNCTEEEAIKMYLQLSEIIKYLLNAEKPEEIAIGRYRLKAVNVKAREHYNPKTQERYIVPEHREAKLIKSSYNPNK